jgi:hypothetical protein
MRIKKRIISMKEHEETIEIRGSISEIADGGKQSLVPHHVLINNNLGNKTLVMSLPISKFVEMSVVANKKNITETASINEEPIAQRPLDVAHASKLSLYILKGLIKYVAEKNYTSTQRPEVLDLLLRILGNPPYCSLQPITCNIRACQPNGNDIDSQNKDGKITAWLSPKHQLYVIDGQHRRHACEMIMEFLKSVRINHRYPSRPKIITPTDIGRKHVGSEEIEIWEQVFELARTLCSISIEVHLGLDAEQERQLFYDLNNLTKKVETGLAFSYDSTNPVNKFIKEELTDTDFFKPSIQDRDLKNWDDDDGRITRKDLVAINSILFLNKTNSKSAKNNQVKDKNNFGINFWKTINKIPYFGEEGCKSKSVIGQSVTVKAIAKIAYDLQWGKNKKEIIIDGVPVNEELTKLFKKIHSVDFSHTNKVWQYYNLDKKTQLNFAGLELYLPPEDESNRDMGAHDGAYMRFGSKHNDIYPLVGDIIRWHLKLPNRNQAKHEAVTNAA